MKLGPRRAMVGIAAALLAVTGSLVVVGSAAAGPATSPFDPAANGATKGTVSFYDASGHKIFNGSLSTPPAFVKADSDAGASGDTIGTVYVAIPDKNKPNPLDWASDLLGDGTYNPAPADWPAAVKDGKVVGQPQIWTEGPGLIDPNTDAAWKDLRQIRLFSSGPGNAVNPHVYSSATLSIDSSAGTWTQVFPTPSSTPAPTPTATQTSLAVSPAGPVTRGTPVTLTATVSPAVDGTVQFKDGAADLGSPVSVVSGVATYTSTSLSAASHDLTAAFAPADVAAYAVSTSNIQTLVVEAVAATATTTSLAVSPTGPVMQGRPVTLTATVTPSGATGTVQFLDGDAAIGSPATLSGGTATLATSTLSAGNRSLSARFVPADPDVFAGSTSGAHSLVVDRAPAAATTTTLNVPAGPVVAGTSVALAATVDPGTAVGAVQFYDGTSALDVPHTLSGGAASITTTTLAAGSHSLTARFIPADSMDFVESVSSAASLVVTPPPTATSTALAAVPSSGALVGSDVTLTATVEPSSAVGTIQFKDGTTDLGAPVAVAAGTTTSTVSSLVAGPHSLAAVFVPTDAANFAGSASPALILDVARKVVDLTVLGADGQPLPANPELAPGATVEVRGTGFVPDETVKVLVRSTETQVGTAVADSAGDVQTSATLPTALDAGSHTLVAQGAAVEGQFPFTVAAAAGAVNTQTGSTGGVASTSGTSASGSLPRTGAPIALLALAAGVTSAIGAALMLGGRTRYRRAH